MFERFTERARQVIVLAQDEARGLSHNSIGTEHLLLGLLREEEGLAARILGSLGITIEEARAQVARIVGPGDELPSGQIPFTPRAKKVLELSLREALSLGHNYIGTEHILLGLVRENDGVSARILVEFGADADTIRNKVIEELGSKVARRAYAQPGSRVRFRRPRREYRIELLSAADREADEASLNQLGDEGWQLTSAVNSEQGLLAFLQRERPLAQESPWAWSVGALGVPWSQQATRGLPLTIGFILDCLVRAAAIAGERDDSARQDEFADLERRMRDDLAAVAEAVGSSRALPEAMRFDTVFDLLAAVALDQKNDGGDDACAGTKELERRLQVSLELASQLLHELPGAEAEG